MENERREQATPATPILDSIVAKLPPPSLSLEQQMLPNVLIQARDRLSKKMEAGALTQKDIENELSSLPADVGGIEVRMKLVTWVQINSPHYDIKSLPVE